MPALEHSIAEYEVFKNDRNALAFFMARHAILDKNPAEGPFWFTLQNGSIMAGTETNHVLFQGVQPDVIDIAQQRGVIMLVEFENQRAVRCTPCYLQDNF